MYKVFKKIEAQPVFLQRSIIGTILLFCALGIPSRSFALPPEQGPYDNLLLIVGSFPKNDPKGNKELQEYFRELLIKMYPEDANIIRETEIAILNDKDFRAEIRGISKKIRLKSGAVKKRFQFCIGLSAEALKKIAPNENVLMWVLGHEWRHSQQFREYGRMPPEEKVQELELDADGDPIERMVKAGRDPSPLLDYLIHGAGKELLQYRSFFLRSLTTSHPNIELRQTNLQKRIAESLEGKVFEHRGVQSLPSPIVVHLGHEIETSKKVLLPESICVEKLKALNGILEKMTRLLAVSADQIRENLGEIAALKSQLLSITSDSKSRDLWCTRGKTPTWGVISMMGMAISRLKGISKSDADDLSRIGEEICKGFGVHGTFKEFIKKSYEAPKWNEYDPSTRGPLTAPELENLNRILHGWLRLSNHWEYLAFEVPLLDLVRLNELNPDDRAMATNLITRLLLESEKNFQIGHGSNLDSLWIQKLRTTILLNAMSSQWSEIHPILSMWKPMEIKISDPLAGVFKLAFTELAKIETHRIFDPALPRSTSEIRIGGDNPVIEAALGIPSQMSHEELLARDAHLARLLETLTSQTEDFTGTNNYSRRILVAQLQATLDEQIKLISRQGGDGTAYSSAVSPQLRDAFNALNKQNWTKYFNGENRLQVLATRFQHAIVQYVDDTQGIESIYELWKSIAAWEVTYVTDELLERFILPEIRLNPDLREAWMTNIFDNNLTKSKFRLYQEILLKHCLYYCVHSKLVFTPLYEDLISKDAKRRRTAIRRLPKWIKENAPELKNEILLNAVIDLVGEKMKATVSEWILLQKIKKYDDVVKDHDPEDNDFSILEAVTVYPDLVKDHYPEYKRQTDLLLRLEVWERKPPSEALAQKILSSPDYWIRKDVGRDNSETLKLRKMLGEQNLVSPFYKYDLFISEQLQRVIWPILCPASCQADPEEAFKVWKKLALKGATEFTDYLFKNSIFPRLKDLKKGDWQRTYLEPVLQNQLVYDFRSRKLIWDEYSQTLPLMITLAESGAGKRGQAIEELNAILDRYFPESSPIREEIVEHISNSIRTDYEEALRMDRMKSVKNQEDAGAMSTRLFNAIVDGAKKAFPIDKILLLKYLRGDLLDRESVMNALFRIRLATASEVRALKRVSVVKTIKAKRREERKTTVGGVIESWGYERVQRFWNELSVEAQAGLINPLLIGPMGLLTSEEGRQYFLEEIIPKKSVVDPKEAKAALLDYIDSLKDTGRGYLDSFVQSNIFFRNKQGANRGFGKFLAELCESSGPVGIALAQQIANMEVLDPSDNVYLEQTRDEALPPSRASSYMSLKPALNPRKRVILAKKLLGSASVKSVVEGDIFDESGNPTGESRAFGIFRESAQELIERDGKTLLAFLERRIAANPARYGFLMPILQHIIAKKKREARSEHEVLSSRIGKEVYSRRSDRVRDGWKIEVIDVNRTRSDRVIEMDVIHAKRFSEFSPQEADEVSNLMVKLHTPEGLGTSALMSDYVIINPDIHSGNLLVDPINRTLYLFDNGQMVALPKLDLQSFYELLAMAALIRLDPTNVAKKTHDLTIALETMTGTKPPPSLSHNIADYFKKTNTRSSSTEQIISDIINIQRLAGNDGVYLSSGFQDWINMLQKILWYQKRTKNSDFSKAVQEKVGKLGIDHALGLPLKVHKQNPCLEELSLLRKVVTPDFDI